MAAAASSSAFTPKTYDVFLSFRGEDTRDNITSHLHAALERTKLETYIDNRLERGQEIWSEIQRAIEESKISVVIFPKGYANSSWCLNELLHIIQCREKYGQFVIRFFITWIHHKCENNEEASISRFLCPDACYKNKMNEWGHALTASANISGWDSTTIR